MPCGGSTWPFPGLTWAAHNLKHGLTGVEMHMGRSQGFPRGFGGVRRSQGVPGGYLT